MTESQKNTVSILSAFGSAVIVLVFIFMAAMAAGCAAAPKTPPTTPQSNIVYMTRICDDQVSEFTYTKDIIKVCMTNTGAYTVYDVDCDGENLEVCDNEMSYIVVGGKTKTFSRNCKVPVEEGVKNAHLRCLSEVLK
jgi:hypothetical protein